MLFLNFIFFLIAITQSSKTSSPNPMHCVLAMRLYPFDYIERTTTIQFKIRFDSNCMPYFQMQYFIIPWRNFYEMDSKRHPKEINVRIMDTEYVIKFDEQHELEDGDFQIERYILVRVQPSHYENIDVNVSYNNYFQIDPPEDKFWSKERILDFWNIMNPTYCTPEDDFKKLICTIIPGKKPK